MLRRKLTPVAALIFILAPLSCGKPSSAGSNAPARHARSKPVIGVGRIYDARRENGSTLELPNMPEESKFVNETDLGPWAVSALAQELTQAGYSVVQYSSVPPDTVEYTITGNIQELTLSRIVFRLLVSRGGATVLDQQYTGQPAGLDNPNAKLTRTQLQAALMQTYKVMAEQVMRDMTKVIK